MPLAVVAMAVATLATLHPLLHPGMHRIDLVLRDRAIGVGIEAGKHHFVGIGGHHLGGAELAVLVGVLAFDPALDHLIKARLDPRKHLGLHLGRIDEAIAVGVGGLQLRFVPGLHLGLADLAIAIGVDRLEVESQAHHAGTHHAGTHVVARRGRGYLRECWQRHRGQCCDQRQAYGGSHAFIS